MGDSGTPQLKKDVEIAHGIIWDLMGLKYLNFAKNFLGVGDPCRCLKNRQFVFKNAVCVQIF